MLIEEKYRLFIKNHSSSIIELSQFDDQQRFSVHYTMTNILFVYLTFFILDLSAKSIQRPRKTTTKVLRCIDDECQPRLLSDIHVHHYQLEYLYKNIDDTTAQGEVTIDFTLKQPTKQLIYHAKRLLNLSEPKLYEDGLYRSVSMRFYTPNDYISLKLLNENETFTPNRYKLKQTFVVNLTDGNLGFYRGTFNQGNGTRGKLLATKFQPTDARKAFPCFDEPKFKAVFKITIIHPINTTALANFPIIDENIENDLKRTKFADTYPMSTYLAAWAVLPPSFGKFVGYAGEIPITIWARREPIEKGHSQLALDIAIKSVLFFVDYFNTSEPLPPKIDLLAVPDFVTGAMENWGLVSFREDRLMFDETVASSVQKYQLAETISHEIVHFWFGNYVTCEWWNNLWLNEAMATWLSNKPFSVHYTEWNIESRVLSEDVIPVMWDDVKPSSHPVIVHNVTSAADITSIFDSITYSKGASILRMLEKIVGFETFRDGLRDYLMNNAFDVGDPTVFYNKLFTNISGEEFMKNWLEEQNFPLLNVHLRTDENGTEISFNQSRFIISNALDASNLNENYRWKIKTQCVLGGYLNESDTTESENVTIEFYLETQYDTLWIPGVAYRWIKCNRHFHGFYITQYTSEETNVSIWHQLSSLIESHPTFFSNEDKVNLIQDTFLLAYKGLIDYIEPLRIVRALVNIHSEPYVIWRAFEWHWNLLSELVQYLPETWPKFRAFGIDQVLRSISDLDEILQTNSTDDPNTKLVKGLKFSFLCQMEYEDAVDRAHQLFRSIPVEYFTDHNVNITIGSDLLSTIYTQHLKHDDNETDFNLMYNYYKTAMSPQEQTRVLKAISSTNDTDRLTQLLNDGLKGGPNSIKQQDFFVMMVYISRHPAGRYLAWSFYRDNFQKLVTKYTLEHRRFGTVITALVRSFEKESYLDEMYKLFEQYPNAGAGALSRKKAIDQVNMNIEWIRSREKNLQEALDLISQE